MTRKEYLKHLENLRQAEAEAINYETEVNENCFYREMMEKQNLIWYEKIC